MSFVCSSKKKPHGTLIFIDNKESSRQCAHGRTDTDLTSATIDFFW